MSGFQLQGNLGAYLEAEDSESERLGNPVINGILEFQSQRDYYARVTSATMVKGKRKIVGKAKQRKVVLAFASDLDLSLG